MNTVYVVMHNLGMDGDYPVEAFSNKEHADRLCEMYSQTDDYGDYDFYYVSEIVVDAKDIENYYIETDEESPDDYKTLEYSSHIPNAETLEAMFEAENGINLTSCDSIEDLFNKLNEAEEDLRLEKELLDGEELFKELNEKYGED